MQKTATATCISIKDSCSTMHSIPMQQQKQVAAAACSKYMQKVKQ